jgi:hypothetical protein
VPCTDLRVRRPRLPGTFWVGPADDDKLLPVERLGRLSFASTSCEPQPYRAVRRPLWLDGDRPKGQRRGDGCEGLRADLNLDHAEDMGAVRETRQRGGNKHCGRQVLRAAGAGPPIQRRASAPRLETPEARGFLRPSGRTPLRTPVGETVHSAAACRFEGCGLAGIAAE